MTTLYYRRLPTGELAAASTESDGNSNVIEVRAYIIDSVDATLMGGGNLPLTKADVDRLLAQMEPCKSPDDYSDPFGQDWQRRRSRTKNKSPLHKRVAKRRRRTQLAKEIRKLMKLAEERRERERAKLAAKK